MIQRQNPRDPVAQRMTYKGVRNVNTISLPPVAPTLIEATRAIGYSIETAVADILDNSIAAQASVITVWYFPGDNPYVAILDDGTGMDYDQLVQAMRFGSRNPLDARGSSDLGRFGLGLKTASLSQCRRLTVATMQRGAPINCAQWDLDLVAETSDWTLAMLNPEEISQVPEIDRLRKLPSGTLVVWQDLDRMLAVDSNSQGNAQVHLTEKMERCRAHIALVFHRYLTGESGLQRMRVTFNDVPVEPLDPFLAGKSTQAMDDEFLLVEGHAVTVRPYILPHLSHLTSTELNLLGGSEGLRRQQGFYVYRNHRLLIWGTWFHMMRQGDLSKLARVRVDIPNALDHLWALDIKKSMAVPPDVIRKNLTAMIGTIAEKSRRTWAFRGKRETSGTTVHIWNRIKTREGVIYEINREHPLVLSVKTLLQTNKLDTELDELLTQIEGFLPWNQLYVDLTSDERITNDQDISQQELTPLWNRLLAQCEDTNERRSLAARLIYTEPFSQHPEWFRDFDLEVAEDASQ